MASLSTRDPWDPPKIRSRLRTVERGARPAASKNSRRTGLPVTTASARFRRGPASEKATATALTTRASIRFVRPGKAFCS